MISGFLDHGFVLSRSAFDFMTCVYVSFKCSIFNGVFYIGEKFN